MGKKILIVEDEKNIVDILKFVLKKENYDTIEAYDGERGLELALAEDPDMVLLDIMLPKMDGFTVCRRIRQSSMVPIVMLTAREEEVDKVLGLELGADDYITKPFSQRELLARIKANLRRSSLDELMGVPPGTLPNAGALPGIGTFTGNSQGVGGVPGGQGQSQRQGQSQGQAQGQSQGQAQGQAGMQNGAYGAGAGSAAGNPAGNPAGTGAGAAGGASGAGGGTASAGGIASSGGLGLNRSPTAIVYGDIVIDPERYEIRREGKTIDLTLREFELVKFLAAHQGQIFSRENLLQKVWGYEYYGDVRTVDVTVRRLRMKLEKDPENEVYILTKRGVGYYFRDGIYDNR